MNGKVHKEYSPIFAEAEVHGPVLDLDGNGMLRVVLEEFLSD